jgi:hypothetical protein
MTKDKLISVRYTRTGAICFLWVSPDWDYVTLYDEYCEKHRDSELDWPDFLKQKGAKDAVAERWGH